MKRQLLICVFLILLTMLLVLSACTKNDPPPSMDGEPGTEDTPGIGDNPATPPTVKPENAILITEEDIYERTYASWVGQMIGVAWAASTELRFNGVIMPESEMPAWTPSMVNDAFGQDDLFVEVPFINAMKDHGIDCSLDILGQYFADTTFWLAHANHIGRENIRAGIPAAEAGHYKNNWHADDIDWQIEADFLGNAYPGAVSDAAKRAFEIGHLMNYGDGVYGGVWISAMHASAFTADSLREAIDDGIAAIPEGTEFRMVMDDVVKGYDSGMTWEDLWQQIEDRWCMDDKCPEFSGIANIDAKLNAAYVLIGLLYGEGDFEQSILIATRCGQDSDCNPSSVAALLGTFYGLDVIPETYDSALSVDEMKFAFTDYTLKDCVEINCDLAREYLDAHAYKDDEGWWIEKETEVTPVPFEQWPDDEITLYMTVTPKADGIVSIQLLHVAPEEIEIQMDMGDGMVFANALGSYQYFATGTYTITCTATDASGRTAKVEKTVEVKGKRTFNVTASSSNPNPAGGGSRDPNVMCDGVVVESELTQQYDTFGMTGEAWFALSFDRKVTVSKIYFTEGAHFDNGGWFQKAPRAQLLIDGKWTDCDYVFSPLYIEVDDLNAQGKAFETFTFTLNTPTKCEGIRVIGQGGGSQKFASCAELEVDYTDVENPITGDLLTKDPVKDAVPLVSVTSPVGAGCKDIEIMRDGKLPAVGENHSTVQYDTFINNSNEQEDYYGYMFRYDVSVSALTFTEGAHFGNGGWFKNDTLRVEALIDGEWVEVDTTLDKAYPNGDSQSLFGNPYESFTFMLDDEVTCRGIRVIGMAGGEAHFTSISELAVEGEKV